MSTPRLSRLIAESEAYAEHARRRLGSRPQLARAKVLAREVHEIENQLFKMHMYIRQLERALQLEQRARKYAVQLLNARRTRVHSNGTAPLPEGGDVP